MDKLVTAFFVATALVFVLLGLLAVTSGQYVIGGVLLLLGAADIWTTNRRRAKSPVRANATQATPHGPAKPPVPMADDVSLNALREPITACPDCGFLAIRSAGAAGGAYAGGGVLLSACRCPRCGYEGLPIRFAQRDDYARFVAELHALWKARGPEDEP